MKTRSLLLGIAIVAIAAAQPLGAATATSNVTVSATVTASAVLSLGGVTTVTFPNSNPDTVPSIAASEGAISVTAKGRTSTGSNVTLTVQAADDLKSGSDIIDITNVTWTATGTGFANGTMSKSAAVSVGTWANSGNRSGTLSFVLANSWDYETGSYSATATFTLTAP